MTKALLPYYGSAEDVDRITRYLQTKPMGVAESEVTKTLGPKVTDPRKHDFYSVLGFFSRANGYKLTSRGLEYLHADPAKKQSLVQASMREFAPYNSLIDWAYHNNVDVLDADRVKHLWASTFADTVDLENSYRLQAAPVPFFAACQMAGLGTFLVGRRGSKSRVELDRAAVGHFLTMSIDDAPVVAEAAKIAHEIGDDSPAGNEVSQGTVPMNTARSVSGHEFVIPVFGKVARIVWPEPTMTSREWEKVKKVGDAMFADDDVE